MHLAFLHTALAHRETFDRLLAGLAPEVRVDHHVDESLLADARRLGPQHAEVVRRVEAAMRHAAAGGASLVVCSCSTIGAVAERMSCADFPTARVDRAMADRAVALGPRILIMAALADTLAPTEALIRDSARRRGRAGEIEIDARLAAAAWPLFVAGDSAGYAAAIATDVRAALHEARSAAVDAAEAPSPADVVVLAQASMAPAALLLADLGVAVLTSPELGVRAALASLAQQSARIAAPARPQGPLNRGAG